MPVDPAYASLSCIGIVSFWADALAELAKRADAVNTAETRVTTRSMAKSLKTRVVELQVLVVN